ncbi:MAG TPA: hypothetical protein VM241_05040 [Candidatus Thermoplasmatota archaeon]|nr:hypothetical protein [Candidatus Thermoplasmatota archaeon]
MVRNPTVAPGMATLDSGTVLGHLAVALLGTALMALAPSLVPKDATSYQYLPELAAVTGALLVGWAATLRMHALLAALSFVLCAAAFASTLAGPGHVDVQRSAMGLLCAGAILMGSAVRGPWTTPLFLFAPLAIEQVATGTWNLGRAEFSAQWAAAIGCDCPVAGFPAGLAVVGGLLGRMMGSPVPAPRPSGLVPILAAFCAMVTGGVAYTVLPDSLAFWREAAVLAMVLGGALGWVAVAYQLGTWWTVLDGFLASAFILGGAAYAGQDLVRLVSLSDGLRLALVVSLVPAALAAFGLLLRKWLAQRRQHLAKLIESRPVQA